MSTYTDLHNRIKENLTILRKPGSKDDGMSPQKVILVNPENQFYGTFNGKMNTTGGILSGLKIIDSELEGVKLDDASVDGVSLRELKTTADVNTQDIEQLQKDKEAISAAHDALSVGLSGAVDNLSVAVNEKLDNAVEEVKKSIGGVVGDVTTLSIGLGNLSNKVETLSSGMLNGVVYKGQLVLHRDYYTFPRQLFNDDPACCMLEGTQAPLKNGWMWLVSLDRENVSGDYVHVSDPNTAREIDLGKGDCIIIKNHLTSLYEVVPDDQMRMDDFDVINAQDEDDTKICIFKQISAFLNNKIETLSTDLSGDIDDLSAALSGEIDSLSASLSNLIFALSSDLCAEIELDRKTIKEVSAKTLISANAYTNQSIAQLSDTTSSLVSATSADTLAQAKAYTKDYADRRIDELSSTTDSRLSSLSNDLSSYSNKLCSDLSTQVDAEFVHKSGDTIANLFVEGELSVAGKTTISNALELNDDFNASTGTYTKISRDGVVIKTHAGTTLKSDDQIEIKTNAPIVETASRFRGTFTNGLEIASDGGLASLSVNGKTIQSTLDDLSNYLNGKKLDVNLARELSSKLCSDLSTQVDAEFVHKDGDAIAELSVTGQLSVSGKTTLEDEVSINAKNYSAFEVLEGGISAKTDGSVAISANEKIELKSKALIDAAGSRLTGVFTDGVQISSTRGLDDFAVNGKTIQKTLVELSAELTGWTYTQDLELSNEVDRKRDALSTSLSATVDIIAANLSTYSQHLCSEVSTQVNNEFVHLSGDKISWIDVENLSAAVAKIKQLDALNIASRQLSVDSINDIQLKSGNSIILSTASGIYTNAGLDKVVLAGTSLQTTMHNVSSYLDTKKLDVELANQLSTKICSDVVGSGYLKAISVDFRYDAHDKLIKLSAGNSVYQISADDFIKDGMLQDVKYDAVGDDTHLNPPYIVLNFNTDAGKDDIWLRVNDLVDIYKASEDGITLSDNIFSLKYNDIKEKIGLNALSDDLYGVLGDPRTVGRLEDLQNQIDAISVDNFGVITFTGHLVPDLNVTASYSSVGAFLQSTRGEDHHEETLKVKNGASFNIYFKEKDRNNPKMISVDNAGSTLLLGNGDVLVVHDHSNSEYIELSNLLVATDENPISGGNVYILKAGTSRYEFEAEVAKRIENDNFISSWIERNFANSGIESYASTTTLNRDISASRDLSVAGRAVFLTFNDLIAKDTLCSIADLCVGLSVGIQNLSTDLSTSISTLTSQIEFALSALDKDPLSSLNADSKISAVIDAVLDIRDTLSALRSILREFDKD